MENCTIREANLADLPAILDILNQPEMENGEALSLTEAESLVTNAQQQPFYKIYLAEINNQAVGTFTLIINKTLGHKGAGVALVETVAVKPESQGTGLGKKMMTEALKVAAEHSCYKLMLSSSLKREKAHGFYDNLGFERHGHSFLITPTTQYD